MPFKFKTYFQIFLIFGMTATTFLVWLLIYR